MDRQACAPLEPFVPGSPQERAVRFVLAASDGQPIARDMEVNVHFHPDRLHHDVPILERMGIDGVYRSQFETGASNGGLGTHRGSQRWQWESRMFGGAYDEAAPHERPKYGALNFRRRARGAAPRFGSAFFRLRPEVLGRCTFCYPDSVFDPRHFGAAQRMDLIAKALADRQDALDDYIEAHVHGPVRIDTDVAALVLDRCYRDTEIEALARRLPCPLEWHAGFRIDTAILRDHADYRSPRHARLGRELAADGYLDARLLGLARRTGRYDEQDLKKVWHYVARFGGHARLAGGDA